MFKTLELPGLLWVRFKICVHFGSARGSLWVCSESTRGSLWVHSGSALIPLGVGSASALEGPFCRHFIINPDWQLCYVKQTPGPLYGFASEIGVRFWGSLCVRSGFALRLVGVHSGSALADPDRTLKANPRSGSGPLSVRLGPVGVACQHMYNVALWH